MAANQNEIDCHEQTDSRHVGDARRVFVSGLGTAKARDWYLKLRDNGAEFVAGNKQVAAGVGQGSGDWLDRHRRRHRRGRCRPAGADRVSDAGAAADSGLGTLFIPNTVAVIKGCPNPAGAQRLVDYLLTAEVESKLAEAASKQIPLNPNVKAKLPPQNSDAEPGPSAACRFRTRRRLVG